ncbi:hypothetical protein FBU30_004771 [Linnemannia zychae]|nr:hypothetical protein FBU30_004771 [Linnemannia zychae]
MYRKANPKIRTREKTDRFGTAGQERSKENIDVNYADSGGEDTSDRSKQYSDYDIHEDIDEMENDTNIDREMVTEDEAADDDDENDDSDEDDNDSDSDVELLESDDIRHQDSIVKRE